MTSRDGQPEDGVPVFRIDEEEIVDLASLLEDDSASTGPTPQPGQNAVTSGADFSAMRQSAIESAAKSLATSLEADTEGGGSFDDAVSALIYGTSSPNPPSDTPSGNTSTAARTPGTPSEPNPARSPAPSAAPAAPPTLEESAESTAGNVFKVDLDDMDDFEALLQRTMGEAAGISVEIAPKAPEAQAAPTESGPVPSPGMQWRKPDKAKEPERPRRDEPSQESKAVDELRKKVKEMTSETESYRRRLQNEAKAARGKGREDVFKTLMPIMDALDMALKSVAENASQDDQLIKGIELVRKQLNTDLGLLGLEQIAPLGETFDPNVHEAFQQVVTGKVQPGQVAEVVRNGYRVEEKLLRPAQVLVEKA